MKKSFNFAALAYTQGSVALADAALVLAHRNPHSSWDRRARQLAALTKGGGVSPFVFTYLGQPFTFNGISFTYGAG